MTTTHITVIKLHHVIYFTTFKSLFATEPTIWTVSKPFIYIFVANCQGHTEDLQNIAMRQEYLANSCPTAGLWFVAIVSVCHKQIWHKNILWTNENHLKKDKMLQQVQD